MARAARLGEILLAAVGVADHDRGRLVARGVVTGDSEAVHERGEVRDLVAGQGKRRHAPIGPASTDDRANPLAFLIVENELRSQQAGSAVAASNIRTMTERTVGAERGPSSFDGGLVLLALRIRADPDASDPAASRRS